MQHLLWQTSDVFKIMFISFDRLAGEEGEREMAQITEELEPELRRFRTVLRVEGLGTFGQRVLYAKV